MPPRRGKLAQQVVDDEKIEVRELTQDPFHQLVGIVSKAYEEGIKEGKKSLAGSEGSEIEIAPTKIANVNNARKMKVVQTGEDSSGNNKKVKRKWNEGNSRREGSQSKKKNEEACNNCGKKHKGTCLKGKSICYNCKQEDYIAPNCPEPKKGGCFSYGITDHRIKNCPKKKEMAREKSKPKQQKSVVDGGDGEEGV